MLIAEPPCRFIEEEKLLPHPFFPLLTALGVAGGTESAALAGEHQQPPLPAVGTPDAGKPAHRVAAVQIPVKVKHFYHRYGK